MLLHIQKSLKLSIAVPILLLCGCTPALNWREVRQESPDGSTLKAALPCKPDVATRQQKLENIQVELSMMGCIANETTFTLSRIPLDNALDVPKVLAAWQTAAVTNLNAKNAPLVAISVTGASAWPAATRVTLEGAANQAHMLWFAKQTATGVSLYQAAMYGNQLNKVLSKEASTTFFESLQLQ
jgi:hypothetical protein